MPSHRIGASRSPIGRIGLICAGSLSPDGGMLASARRRHPVRFAIRWIRSPASDDGKGRRRCGGSSAPTLFPDCRSGSGGGRCFLWRISSSRDGRGRSGRRRRRSPGGCDGFGRRIWLAGSAGFITGVVRRRQYRPAGFVSSCGRMGVPMICPPPSSLILASGGCIGRISRDLLELRRQPRKRRV